MARPLVALCCYYLPPSQVAAWSAAAYALPDRYVACLRDAGVEPILVVPGADIEALADVDLMGIVLAGGGDIDPARYGGRPDHPTTYGVVPERDDTETALLTRAVEADLPLLAICRGMQLLNVARGGTLVQHLPDLLGSYAHGDPVAQRSNEHDVRLEPDSRLASELGEPEAGGCVSFHHQAVDRVGEGLRVVGRSDDGVVEGLEATDASWVVGVQWHPEISGTRGVHDWLFDAFADRVHSHAQGRVTR